MAQHQQRYGGQQSFPQPPSSSLSYRQHATVPVGGGQDLDTKGDQSEKAPGSPHSPTTSKIANSIRERKKLILFSLVVVAILGLEALWVIDAAGKSHARQHHSISDAEEQAEEEEHYGLYDHEHDMLYRMVGKKVKQPSIVEKWSEEKDPAKDQVEAFLKRFPALDVDAIIVLSGGSGIPKWVRYRLEAAKLLQETIHEQMRHKRRQLEAEETEVDSDTEALYRHGPLVIVSGAGSPHIGPTYKRENGVDHIYHEATEGCDYLRAIGYEGPLEKEIFSFDTIGQSFFLRAGFGQVLGWQRIIIITSEWHIRRARYLFELVWGLKPAMLTHLVFLGTAAGADSEAVTKRHVIEEESLKAAKERFGYGASDPKTRSFKLFHRWLFNNHTCYDENGPRETALQKHDVLY